MAGRLEKLVHLDWDWYLDTYELRHTAASIAIAAGADVKTVQLMLGHSSAAMTLDIYAHLWEEGLDAIPSAMEAHMESERKRLQFVKRQKRNTGELSLR
ncbi:hypothetical protein KPHES18084_01680 [Corynebacterium ulcerans]